MLKDRGVDCVQVESDAVRESLAGHLMQLSEGRSHVTLKLAMSLDGCIAMANGESQWITGETARAHTHRERARADAILVGGETLRSDNPRLNVRLGGLENRSPRKLVLTRGNASEGWEAVKSPEAIRDLADARYLFIEGGAGAASAFLEADLVDRLLIYRAPILIGGGRAGVSDFGLGSLQSAHGRWRPESCLTLGEDRLEIYTRTR